MTLSQISVACSSSFLAFEQQVGAKYPADLSIWYSWEIRGGEEMLKTGYGAVRASGMMLDECQLFPEALGGCTLGLILPEFTMV